ncbi:hypothetical protein DL89DRAFT_265700, partial [Linderina pennispora]
RFQLFTKLCNFKTIASVLLVATTVSVFTAAFANRIFFENGKDAGMSKPFTFDSNSSGPPALSDTLMRALSGNSDDFKSGLTLLLPTNQAFTSLGEIPDDLDIVMKRHVIAQTVTPAMMKAGLTVDSYEKQTLLRFSSSSGKVYVQAGTQRPVEVRGQGTVADNGVYYLVGALFI